MIFVTIGTTERFDRLLDAVDSFRLDEEIVVQCGDSPARPARSTCVTFLAYDDLVAHVRRARVVVAHAGVGTIMTSLANDKRPIVVPRRPQFGEAVDNHQLELATRLAQLGLVTLVEEPGELEAAIAAVVGAEPWTMGQPRPSPLASELRAYLEGEIARRSTKRKRTRWAAGD